MQESHTPASTLHSLEHRLSPWFLLSHLCAGNEDAHTPPNGRAMMRDWLFARVGGNGKDAFSFMAVRCDRAVLGVFAGLRGLSANDLQMS
jgi:hypothetical protein